MRAHDFIKEDLDDQDSGEYGNIVTALNLLHNEVIDGNLGPEIPTEMVIRYVRNTGINSFTYRDLLAANEAAPALKELIKNITPETVKFSSNSTDRVSNPGDYTSASTNPEQTVSNMAKSAMKRRLK